MRVSNDFMIPSWFVIILVVPAFLFAQVREVVHARPIPRPLALVPVIGLRFGFLLDGRFSRERVEGGALLVFAGELVGLRVREVGVVDVFHIVRIWDVEVKCKRFFR